MTEELAVRKLEFQTQNAAETIAIGKQLVDALTLPTLLILTGTLGSGKTTLVKGIAEAIDDADPD